jgi:hypothetical protein
VRPVLAFCNLIRSTKPLVFAAYTLLRSLLLRLNRLALGAPPSGALYALALTRNLLQKYRECSTLIKVGSPARMAPPTNIWRGLTPLVLMTFSNPFLPLQ